jgi:hypothetical protein
MEILEKTYDRACCEVEDILNRQSLSKQDVELWGDLIDIIKDVEMVYDYQDKMEGYSQMNGMRGRSGRMMPMYNRGSSYGRNGGYSRTSNKDEMLDHLQDAMDIAVDEKDKKAVERLMSQMMERN